MLRYVMMRIPGTHALTKHRRSPGVHCTSLGRLGGIKQHGGLTVVWSKREMEGPPGTEMPSEWKATGSWP